MLRTLDLNVIDAAAAAAVEYLASNVFMLARESRMFSV
jgi:hypothetical protein